jgi:hypothetical protein
MPPATAAFTSFWPVQKTSGKIWLKATEPIGKLAMGDKDFEGLRESVRQLKAAQGNQAPPTPA